MSGKYSLSATTLEGQVSTCPETRGEHLIYYRMFIDDGMADEESSVYFGGWRCYSVYVHDTRIPNGAFSQGFDDSAFSRVKRSLPRLVARNEDAAAAMLMWPNGDERPGTTVPYVTGGAFPIDRDVYFVIRCTQTGRRYLLCHVY